jgi:hypothetical protein
LHAQEEIAMSIPRFASALAALGAVFAVASSAQAGPQFVVALQGYDAVSFFAGERAPAHGAFEHSVHWNGATWLFATDANARRFKENPGAYAPQFDGYCALAASLGYKAPAEAATGKVVNGKLYVNYNSEAARVWSEDIPGNIAKGDKNWPKLNAF